MASSKQSSYSTKEIRFENVNTEPSNVETRGISRKLSNTAAINFREEFNMRQSKSNDYVRKFDPEQIVVHASKPISLEFSSQRTENAYTKYRSRLHDDDKLANNENALSDIEKCALDIGKLVLKSVIKKPELSISDSVNKFFIDSWLEKFRSSSEEASDFSLELLADLQRAVTEVTTHIPAEDTTETIKFSKNSYYTESMLSKTLCGLGMEAFDRLLSELESKNPVLHEIKQTLLPAIFSEFPFSEAFEGREMLHVERIFHDAEGSNHGRDLSGANDIDNLPIQRKPRVLFRGNLDAMININEEKSLDDIDVLSIKSIKGITGQKYMKYRTWHECYVELKQILKNNDHKVSNFFKERDDLHSNIDNLKQLLYEANQSNNDLRIEKDVLTNQYKTLETIHNQLRSKTENLELLLDKEKSERRDIEAKYSSMKKVFDQSTDSTEQDNEMISLIKKKYKQLKDDYDGLNKDFEKLYERNLDLNYEIDSYKKYLKSLENQQDEYKEQLTVLHETMANQLNSLQRYHDGDDDIIMLSKSSLTSLIGPIADVSNGIGDIQRKSFKINDDNSMSNNSNNVSMSFIHSQLIDYLTQWNQAFVKNALSSQSYIKELNDTNMSLQNQSFQLDLNYQNQIQILNENMSQEIEKQYNNLLNQINTLQDENNQLNESNQRFVTVQDELLNENQILKNTLTKQKNYNDQQLMKKMNELEYINENQTNSIARLLEQKQMMLNDNYLIDKVESYMKQINQLNQDIKQAKYQTKYHENMGLQLLNDMKLMSNRISTILSTMPSDIFNQNVKPITRITPTANETDGRPHSSRIGYPIVSNSPYTTTSVNLSNNYLFDINETLIRSTRRAVEDQLDNLSSLLGNLYDHAVDKDDHIKAHIDQINRLQSYIDNFQMIYEDMQGRTIREYDSLEIDHQDLKNRYDTLLEEYNQLLQTMTADRDVSLNTDDITENHSLSETPSNSKQRPSGQIKSRNGSRNSGKSPTRTFTLQNNKTNLKGGKSAMNSPDTIQRNHDGGLTPSRNLSMRDSNAHVKQNSFKSRPVSAIPSPAKSSIATPVSKANATITSMNDNTLGESSLNSSPKRFAVYFPSSGSPSKPSIQLMKQRLNSNKSLNETKQVDGMDSYEVGGLSRLTEDQLSIEERLEMIIEEVNDWKGKYYQLKSVYDDIIDKSKHAGYEKLIPLENISDIRESNDAKSNITSSTQIDHKYDVVYKKSEDIDAGTIEALDYPIVMKNSINGQSPEDYYDMILNFRKEINFDAVKSRRDSNTNLIVDEGGHIESSNHDAHLLRALKDETDNEHHGIEYFQSIVDKATGYGNDTLVSIGPRNDTSQSIEGPINYSDIPIKEIDSCSCNNTDEILSSPSFGENVRSVAVQTTPRNVNQQQSPSSLEVWEYNEKQEDLSMTPKTINDPSLPSVVYSQLSSPEPSVVTRAPTFRPVPFTSKSSKYTRATSDGYNQLTGSDRNFSKLPPINQSPLGNSLEMFKPPATTMHSAMKRNPTDLNVLGSSKELKISVNPSFFQHKSFLDIIRKNEKQFAKEIGYYAVMLREAKQLCNYMKNELDGLLRYASEQQHGDDTLSDMKSKEIIPFSSSIQNAILKFQQDLGSRMEWIFDAKKLERNLTSPMSLKDGSTKDNLSTGQITNPIIAEAQTRMMRQYLEAKNEIFKSPSHVVSAVGSPFNSFTSQAITTLQETPRKSINLPSMKDKTSFRSLDHKQTNIRSLKNDESIQSTTSILNDSSNASPMNINSNSKKRPIKTSSSTPKASSSGTHKNTSKLHLNKMDILSEQRTKEIPTNASFETPKVSEVQDQNGLEDQQKGISFIPLTDRDPFIDNKSNQLFETLDQVSNDLIQRAYLHGGWKTILYTKDGSINPDFDLTVWPIHDQVAILQEVIQYERDRNNKLNQLYQDSNSKYNKTVKDIRNENQILNDTLIEMKANKMLTRMSTGQYQHHPLTGELIIDQYHQSNGSYNQRSDQSDMKVFNDETNKSMLFNQATNEPMNPSKPTSFSQQIHSIDESFLSSYGEFIPIDMKAMDPKSDLITKQLNQRDLAIYRRVKRGILNGKIITDEKVISDEDYSHMKQSLVKLIDIFRELTSISQSANQENHSDIHNKELSNTNVPENLSNILSTQSRLQSNLIIYSKKSAHKNHETMSPSDPWSWPQRQGNKSTPTNYRYYESLQHKDKLFDQYLKDQTLEYRKHMLSSQSYRPDLILSSSNHPSDDIINESPHRPFPSEQLIPGINSPLKPSNNAKSSPMKQRSKSITKLSPLKERKASIKQQQSINPMNAIDQEQSSNQQTSTELNELMNQLMIASHDIIHRVLVTYPSQNIPISRQSSFQNQSISADTNQSNPSHIMMTMDPVDYIHRTYNNLFMSRRLPLYPSIYESIYSSSDIAKYAKLLNERVNQHIHAIKKLEHSLYQLSVNYNEGASIDMKNAPQMQSISNNQEIVDYLLSRSNHLNHDIHINQPKPIDESSDLNVSVHHDQSQDNIFDHHSLSLSASTANDTEQSLDYFKIESKLNTTRPKTTMTNANIELSQPNSDHYDSRKLTYTMNHNDIKQLHHKNTINPSYQQRNQHGNRLRRNQHYFHNEPSASLYSLIPTNEMNTLLFNGKDIYIQGGNIIHRNGSKQRLLGSVESAGNESSNIPAAMATNEYSAISDNDSLEPNPLVLMSLVNKDSRGQSRSRERVDHRNPSWKPSSALPSIRRPVQ